jgi:hypothetical protein
MPNKIIKTSTSVGVRIDNAYTTNEKHLVTPYVRPQDGKETFFGSFKFQNPKEARETLKDAIQQLGAQDTIFAGNYPKWIEDEYGIQLKVGNRVRFFEQIGSNQEVSPLEIRDNVYSLEIQLTPTKDNEVYLRVVRAIKIGATTPKFNDELFEDTDLPF